MDFFAHQDRARQNTLWLVGLYLLALAVVVLAVDTVMAGAFLWALHDRHSGVSLWHLLLQLPRSYFLYASLLCVVTILGGSIYRILQLAEGGDAVAVQLGGRKVLRESADPYERRLLNIVEEMSLAAGVPMPAVHVIDEQNDINAFAAGWTQDDAAVGVSRGALRMLKRDELQGVLAHEFGHVLNGDMRLNTLMAGMINGLLVVALAGDWILSARTDSDFYYRASRNSVSWGYVAMGAGLYVLGYLGVFLGQLIQAAVSRQRELLADASAVQFTRNPDGIGSALRKIGGARRRSGKDTARLSPYSHLFFMGGPDGWLSGLTATHPSLEQRIAAIYGGRFMPFIDVVIDEDPIAAPPQPATFTAGSATALVEQLAGSQDGQSRSLGDRLSLLDQALPALMQLDAAARQQMLERAARLAMADGQLDLREFALMTVLESRLASPAPVAQQSYVPLADRFEDIRLVLSLLAHGGAAAGSVAAYAKACQLLGLPPDLALLPREGIQLGAVRAAMRRLNQLLPVQKQALIRACTQCVMSDGRLDPLEADLLRAVAASLDCTLPQPIS